MAARLWHTVCFSSVARYVAEKIAATSEARRANDASRNAAAAKTVVDSK